MVSGRPTRIEVSAGGVVYRRPANDALQVLLIRDSYGNWGFPKGHVESGETGRQAALRECQEETGLTRLQVVAELGTTDWYFAAGAVRVHKFCDYFLLASDPQEEPEPLTAEGIRECVWLTEAAAAARVTYDNARHVLRLARQQVGAEREPRAVARGQGK